jgi:ABC-2 type transport system ATP-binding protein
VSALLRLDDLHRSFGSTVAVDGLSLEVASGEVLGLLGPNGAGKSTTIGMIAGLLRPDRGAVVIDGRGGPEDPEIRRLLGLAPQSLALYDSLTATENLRLFAELYDLRGSSGRERARELLVSVGLDGRADERVAVYSGGMKRRLNLAAALLHRPRLLLLDEPTVGVDPQSRSSIIELIRTIAAAGTSVIYSTHYMEEAQRICDRVAIIDHGKLLDVDTVDNLIDRHGGKPILRTIKDGEETQIVTDDPVRELSALFAAGSLESVRIDRPDLEAVFLALTGRTLRDL